MPETHDYTGLTPDELAALVSSSAQHPGEDSTDWAARARLEADKAAAVAAERRAAAVTVEHADELPA